MKTENHYTETDLGNISLNPRGEYDPEAFYEYLDTVSMDGGSYMCLAELGTKITGIPPVPGTNTEHWQVLTLPGGLTPEYITMHDEVTEKAKQVEVSRAAVELSQSEIEAMQADVAQLHKDTQDSAQSALASKNQAAGYASAADTSRQAAERAKQDVDAQIPNIDAKLQAALNDIDDARQSANASVKKQENLSAQAVKDQTGEYITEQKNLAKQELDQKVDSFNLDVNAIKKQVSDEGAKQVEAIQTAQTTAMKAVETAKSEAVQAVKTEGAAQTGNVTAEGAKQVQAVQQAAQEIVADREQIAQNKAGIEALKQGKADAIVETASGEDIQIEDGSGLGFEGLRIFGKSMQDGVPSPESPVPIVNVGDKGNITIKLTGRNLLKLNDQSGGNRGVTVVCENGEISLVGTAVETGWCILEKIPPIILNGEYTISSNTDIQCGILDDRYKLIIQSGKSEKVVNKTASKLFFYVISETKYNIRGIKTMLNKGNEALPYETYKPVQTLTIQTPNGLPGIKVDSGGNYTDKDGQQWICDVICEKDGVIGIERNVYPKHYTQNDYRYNSAETEFKLYTYTDDEKNIINEQTEAICDVFVFDKRMKDNYTFRAVAGGIKAIVNGATSLDDLKRLLPDGFDVLFIRNTPTFEPFPQDIQNAYKALHTNYPTTVISNDESAHMEVSYVADTKNYIDKKFKELSQAIVNTQIALL